MKAIKLKSLITGIALVAVYTAFTITPSVVSGSSASSYSYQSHEFYHRQEIYMSSFTSYLEFVYPSIFPGCGSGMFGGLEGFGGTSQGSCGPSITTSDQGTTVAQYPNGMAIAISQEQVYYHMEQTWFHFSSMDYSEQWCGFCMGYSSPMGYGIRRGEKEVEEEAVVEELDETTITRLNNALELLKD